MAYQRLGDMLVGAGVIPQEALDRALAIQKGTGKRLGEVLIDNGIVSEEDMLSTLGAQMGVQVVDLSAYPPAPDAAKYLSRAIARKHQVVPLGTNGDTLYLAMLDPMNFMAIEEAKRYSHMKVTPMITSRANLERASAKLYGSEGAAQALKEMSRELTAIPAGTANNAVAASSSITDDPAAAPTVRLVNSILERAVTERASDIHFEPRESEMVVRMRIDGSLHILFRIPGQAMNAVISRLKVMGNMDIAERRIPQDGRANVRVRERDVDLRISTLPTVYGEKMVIRLLDKSVANLGRQGIGLTGTSLERYEELLRNSSGVILISGPTGSGKSSTMYTMIQDLNTEQVNLVTLEDPVEFNTEGVNQCQVNEKTGMTFAAGLRSILRQDPDIIVVGEIRDGETASIAMRAAITGHLVLSTIHTSDAAATLDRLFDIGVEPYLTASALKGVVAQRLVRRVCPHCKRAYEPTDGELELLGMERTPEMKFYRGDGCPMCFHTGYRGRTGVFEILLIGHDVRRLITARAGREAILAAARGDGFTTLAEHCRALVRAGVTTAEEAARTINSTLD